MKKSHQKSSTKLSQKNSETFFKKIFFRLDHALARVADATIRVYQRTISPSEWRRSPVLRDKICAHEPHCSAHARQSLGRFGFLRALPKIIFRIFSCGPAMTKKYDPAFYRVIFCSSSAISLPFLDQLHDDPHFELVGVVTAPPAPADRGQKIKKNPVQLHAEKRWISPIFTPKKINPDRSDAGRDFFEEIAKLQADFLVVIAYGKILPQKILDLPRIAPINIHGSLLPRRRGASPIQSTLLHDDSQHGISVMKMDAGLDTGPVISQLKTKLSPNRTATDQVARIQKNGPAHLAESLRKFAQNLRPAVPQDKNLATHCTKIAKSDGTIDPRTQPLHEILLRHRAFSLRPKTFFEFSPEKNSEKNHEKNSPENSRQKIWKNEEKSTTNFWNSDENLEKKPENSENSPQKNWKKNWKKTWEKNHKKISLTITELRVDPALLATHGNTPLLDTENSLNPAVTTLLVRPANRSEMSRSDFLHGLHSHKNWWPDS